MSIVKLPDMTDPFYGYIQLADNFGEYFAAGMMGNLMVESGLKSNNLQNGYESKLGYTDDTYTADVDSGYRSKDEFSNDHAGYGLAQWTYNTRKAMLYDFTKAYCPSIGDFKTQICFIIFEVNKSYKKLIKNFSAENPADAADEIVKSYFKPAWICNPENYSEEKINSLYQKRENAAMDMYTKFHEDYISWKTFITEKAQKRAEAQGRKDNK